MQGAYLGNKREVSYSYILPGGSERVQDEAAGEFVEGDT